MLCVCMCVYMNIVFGVVLRTWRNLEVMQTGVADDITATRAAQVAH